MTKLTKGSKVKLYKDKVYEIKDIYFEIGSGGSWISMMSLTDEDGKDSEIPLFVFEDLLRTGDLYRPEQEKFYIELHEIRKRKANDRLAEVN